MDSRVVYNLPKVINCLAEWPKFDASGFSEPDNLWKEAGKLPDNELQLFGQPGELWKFLKLLITSLRNSTKNPFVMRYQKLRGLL